MTAGPEEHTDIPHLVVGGARSGKSRHAEELIKRFPPPYVYMATAQALDEEMRRRIEDHRSRRGTTWQTIEAPLGLVEQLEGIRGKGLPVLVDCLTLWLTNLMLQSPEALDTATLQVERLCDIIRTVDYPLVLVSNEVGSGIVPVNAMARAYRDLAGKTNQQVAAACAGATLVVAGLPVALKRSCRSWP
jgi:adenosylcobinamide kinase / adenosylcobinamide-phosphate guanylyltransferase